jgi:hypothetical protein
MKKKFGIEYNIDKYNEMLKLLETPQTSRDMADYFNLTKQSINYRVQLLMANGIVKHGEKRKHFYTFIRLKESITADDLKIKLVNNEQVIIVKYGINPLARQVDRKSLDEKLILTSQLKRAENYKKRYSVCIGSSLA